MIDHLLEELHAPYAEVLRAALALASQPGARLAVDIGCGPGLKSGWLAERLAPGGLLVGLDIDPAAVAAASAAQPGGWLAGDARDLPLRAGCADLCWCVAVLELLGSPQQALAEARRVLRPGGGLAVASAAQLWARPRAWPAELYAAWAERAPPAPADGLGAYLAEALAGAGFADVGLRAYLLDPAGPGLARAALPLAGWDALAPHVAGLLGPGGCAGCAEAEALAEPEPLAVLLVAAGLSR